MELQFCTPEMHVGLLRTMNFPNVREMLLQACLEAVVEGRRFTYTDIFMGVLPREDEH